MVKCIGRLSIHAFGAREFLHCGKGTDQARRRFPLKQQGVEHGWTSEIGACAQARKPRSPRRKSAASKTSPKRWSQRVTRESDALDLQQGVFKLTSPEKIAASLKRSSERSSRRKAGAYRSALSILPFYINPPANASPTPQRYPFH